MTADLPPLPDAPPIPGVIYTPQEATAWIRTMTPEALVKASRVDPERFPRTQPGREVGFSGEDILAIVAATSNARPVKKRPTFGRPSRPRIAAVSDLPAGEPLVAKPQSARRRSRKAS